MLPVAQKLYVGRKVIYVRCIKCSYNNVVKGIRLLGKKKFCLYRKKFKSFWKIYLHNRIWKTVLMRIWKWSNDGTQTTHGQYPKLPLNNTCLKTRIQRLLDCLIMPLLKKEYACTCSACLKWVGVYTPAKTFIVTTMISTCIQNNVFRACITTSSWDLCPNIEKRQLFKIIPNGMNGFVNGFLR